MIRFGAGSSQVTKSIFKHLQCNSELEHFGIVISLEKNDVV